MNTYTRLTTDDAPFEPFLLWTKDSTGTVVIRPEYKDLVCPKCGKVPERKALERGISQEVVFSTTRDIFGSWETLDIVSIRTKNVLESIPNVDISYYPIPNKPDYFVALPNILLLPQKGHPRFYVHPECPVCGRFREAVWRRGAVELEVQVEVGAFALESSRGLMPAWFVSDQVKRQIKSMKPRLTGFCFLEVLNPRTDI